MEDQPFRLGDHCRYVPSENNLANTSLVLELQQLASRSETDITELLRRSLLVATKLQLEDFRSWINHEMNGYGSSDVPDYRKGRAEIKLRNPYHGLVPLYIPDERWREIFCRIEIREPLAGLADVVRSSGNDAYVQYRLSDEEAQFLYKYQAGHSLPPVRVAAKTLLANVIEAVRNRILDWSLKLEAEGILGEGMTFSDDEKRTANQNTEINIQNFQGIIGDVTDSEVEQKFQMTITQGDFDSLKSYLESAGLSTSDTEELRHAIENDPTPTSQNELGPNVSNWMAKMFQKAASGVWDIGVNAAGGILGTAIATYYGIGT